MINLLDLFKKPFVKKEEVIITINNGNGDNEIGYNDLTSAQKGLVDEYNGVNDRYNKLSIVNDLYSRIRNKLISEGDTKANIYIKMPGEKQVFQGEKF